MSEASGVSEMGTQTLVAALRAAGEKLPGALRDDIIAAGESIVPALIDVMLHDDEVDVKGELTEPHREHVGWASIHSVSLLADLRATVAIAPMLSVLAETEWEHIIHDRIVLRLPDLGADVLEPALAMLADDPTDDLADALCSIVSQLGVQDERIYSALSSHFGRIPEIACSWFVDYRDPRALPMLRKELEDTVPDHHSALGLHPLVDLAEAYELLAGELPHDLRTHVDELIAHWRVRRVSVPKHSPSPPKIGRNDPCPCGSGKKYKRCHFGSNNLSA